jgi:hypothetical protein
VVTRTIGKGSGGRASGPGRLPGWHGGASKHPTGTDDREAARRLRDGDNDEE